LLVKFACFRFACLQAELPVAHPVLVQHFKFEKKKHGKLIVYPDVRKKE
jgi:hypothetical protein